MIGWTATDCLIRKHLQSGGEYPFRWKEIYPSVGEVTGWYDESWDDVWEMQAPTTGGGGGGLLGDIPELGGEGAGGGRGDVPPEIEKVRRELQQLSTIVSETEKLWERLNVSTIRLTQSFGSLADASSRFYSNLAPTITALGTFMRALSSLTTDLGDVSSRLNRALLNTSYSLADLGGEINRARSTAQTIGTLFAALGLGAQATGAGTGAAGAIGGAAVTGVAFSIAIVASVFAVFFASMGRVLSDFSRLSVLFDQITQFIDRMITVGSALNVLGLGLARLPEYTRQTSVALSELTRSLTQAGLNLRDFINTLNTAFGDVERWSAVGFVSMEQWVETLQQLGRLGIRADQFREVLSAAAGGRVIAGAGLGIPPEVVETIAALQYGIVGLGDSAGAAVTRIQELNRQINALYETTSEGSEAVYYFNRISGALSERIREGAEIINAALAEPLQRLYEVLDSPTARAAFRTIAEGIGAFVAEFLNRFTPHLEAFFNALASPQGQEAMERLRRIGGILGAVFGELLETIGRSLPQLMAFLEGMVRFFAGMSRIAMGVFQFFTQILMLPTALGGLLDLIGMIGSAIGKLISFLSNLFYHLDRLISWLVDKVSWFLGGRRREEERTETDEERRRRAVWEFNRALASLLDAIITASNEIVRQADRIRQMAFALAALYAPGGLAGMVTGIIGGFTIPVAGGVISPLTGGRETGIVGVGVATPTAQTTVGFYTLLAGGVMGAYAGLEAVMINIAALGERINEELRQFGTAARTQDLITLYTRLGEEVRKVGEALRSVAQAAEQVYRGMELAAEATERLARLVYGAAALRDTYMQVEVIMRNITSLGEIRRMQMEIEINRLSEVLGFYQAFLQRMIEQQAQRLGITEIPQIRLAEMTPQQVIAIAQQFQIPAPLIEPIIQVMNQLYDAQMRLLGVLREIGSEIVNMSGAMRQAHVSLRDFAIRFGDVETAAEASARILETFDATFQGLIMRAAAALATYRLDEYFRTLEEMVRALNDRYTQLIEQQTRAIQAMARPFELATDRLGIMINMLDRIGASALTLPQIFQEIVPEANRLLNEIMKMADAWREHPEILNRILQEAERIYNRVMDMIGRAGAIVPVVPLTEIIRLAQFPALDPLSLLQRGRAAFGPRYELAGVPITPSYLIPYQFWASGSWVQMPEFRDLLLRPLDIYIREGRLGVDAITRQLDEIASEQRRELQRMISESQRMGEEQRERIGETIERGVQRGYEEAERGLGGRGITPPRVGQFQPTVPISPQVQPVRLRVDLDRDEIVLKVRIVTEDGREVTVPKVIKISPVQEAIRENQPTTGY